MSPAASEKQQRRRVNSEGPSALDLLSLPQGCHPGLHFSPDSHQWLLPANKSQQLRREDQRGPIEVGYYTSGAPDNKQRELGCVGLWPGSLARRRNTPQEHRGAGIPDKQKRCWTPASSYMHRCLSPQHPQKFLNSSELVLSQLQAQPWGSFHFRSLPLFLQVMAVLTPFLSSPSCFHLQWAQAARRSP